MHPLMQFNRLNLSDLFISTCRSLVHDESVYIASVTARFFEIILCLVSRF